MFPYMIGKEEAGPYRSATEHCLKKLILKDFEGIAKNSGAVFETEHSTITLNSLGQSVSVKLPEGKIVFNGTDYCPVLGWRIIILNYLFRADNAHLTGQLVSYRELENGHVFYPAFLRESVNLLIQKFSSEPAEQIKNVCRVFGARLEDKADICAVFEFFPRFPVTVKLWLKDEEIGGSANILFDANANHYLDAEAIAVTCMLISQFLIKQYDMMYKK
ncbi:hypothetical protein Dtox_1614 [Desulfofarcimen acetoxidans DSM 771]|uniref:DUF3786 domain-containing protein n=1 Tax=Desulfofarcimen acetoxidans (strain ATCC 49208 / DSM 771 / KCTC 5769 / VKM B-1644 / 5575) TaxID=485916 RepID=C8VWC0_DESAS|nr:DUF3786 domain-containing protein [Desulfofarcimen acetoxidans]ACV62472.1 hypothetical protein Dtox_1614 [Desulfofarcimen acetoxidans DSM 771]